MGLFGNNGSEANRSPKHWDKSENKTRDTPNKDIDVPSPQDNDGNSSWWHKPDSSNNNKKK